MSRSVPAHSPQGNTWTEMSWAKRKRKYLNEKENHHTWKPSLFWSQPTGIVYLFIYSCWFCWTRCCVPSKTDSKYSIFNNDIDLSSINMYLYAQVYYSFVLWERVGKKISDDVDIHARWTHDLQKSRRMKTVYLSRFPCWVIFTELSMLHLYTAHDVELRIIHLCSQQQHLKYLFSVSAGTRMYHYQDRWTTTEVTDVLASAVFGDECPDDHSACFRKNKHFDSINRVRGPIGCRQKGTFQ